MNGRSLPLAVLTRVRNCNLLLVADLEVGAAATVYVEAVTVTPPGSSLDAGRAAALTYEADSSTRTFLAIMAFLITGLTIEGLSVTPATVPIAVPITVPIAIPVAVTVPITPVAAEFEIGAAAAIDPDPAPVIAPGSPLDAL